MGEGGVGVLVVVVLVLLSLYIVSPVYGIFEVEYRCNQPVPHGFGVKMAVLPN